MLIRADQHADRDAPLYLNDCERVLLVYTLYEMLFHWDYGNAPFNFLLLNHTFIEKYSNVIIFQGSMHNMKTTKYSL